MSGQRRTPSEAFRDDLHAEVAATARRAGMTGMQMTVVGDLDERIRKRRFKTATQLANRGGAHCGALICRASHKPCATIKTKVNPNVPKSLKFTQKSSEKLFAI